MDPGVGPDQQMPASGRLVPLGTTDDRQRSSSTPTPPLVRRGNGQLLPAEDDLGCVGKPMKRVQVSEKNHFFWFCVRYA